MIDVSQYQNVLPSGIYEEVDALLSESVYSLQPSRGREEEYHLQRSEASFLENFKYFAIISLYTSVGDAGENSSRSASVALMLKKL